MGLFRKNTKDTADTSGNKLLADSIFSYLKSEGFFPEKDTEIPDKEATDTEELCRIRFKYEGKKVILDTADGNYIRIIMRFNLDDENYDTMCLMCAASQVMYEVKAVKIVAAASFIQFTIETFCLSADAFTPFLKPYLDIMSEAVGRHWNLYVKFVEDIKASSDQEEDADSDVSGFDGVIRDAIESQEKKSIKN